MMAKSIMVYRLKNPSHRLLQWLPRRSKVCPLDDSQLCDAKQDGQGGVMGRGDLTIRSCKVIIFNNFM